MISLLKKLFKSETKCIDLVEKKVLFLTQKIQNEISVGNILVYFQLDKNANNESSQM